MSLTKDEWMEKTGGFRLGESDKQFQARVDAIQRLEAELRQPGLSDGDREGVQRRLCDLKGLDFDAADGPGD